MAKNIEPKLLKIGEYLKPADEEASFVVPAYQRPYTWGITQCDKLWQDVNDYIDNGGKESHFFGTIIISCSDGDKRLELIDGQQRTTTFLLLLKALLIRINEEINAMRDDEDSRSLRNALRDRRKEIINILYRVDTDEIPDCPDESDGEKIYKKLVALKNESINENEHFVSDFVTIMQSATYSDADSNYYKIPYKQKDNKFTNFFRNFRFFYDQLRRESASEINGFTKTLLKNCEVIEIKSWQIGQAIEMFNSLNADGQPLSDADIISAKMYAAAKDKTAYDKKWRDFRYQAELLEKCGVSDIFGLLMQYMYYLRTAESETKPSGAISVRTPGLRRYFTQDVQNEKTAGSKKLNEQPIELCEDLIRLGKAWEKVSDYTAVKVLLKFNVNAKLFFASYLLRLDEKEITEEKITVVAESFLRLFAAFALVDFGFSSKYIKTFLFEEEIKLVDEKVSEEEIKTDFINHINKSFEKEKLLSQANDCNDNSLVYLNEYLFAQENNIPFAIDKPDIEHIMPQSGRDHSQIRADANIADEDEFKVVVDKLGNKILLEETINRSAGDAWFRTKISKSVSEKGGYKDSKYPIASYLAKEYEGNEQKYWTKDDIAKATEKAANRIVNFIFGADGQE